MALPPNPLFSTLETPLYANVKRIFKEGVEPECEEDDWSRIDENDYAGDDYNAEEEDYVQPTSKPLVFKEVDTVNNSLVGLSFISFSFYPKYYVLLYYIISYFFSLRFEILKGFSEI